MKETPEVSDEARMAAMRLSEELCDELDALLLPRPARPNPPSRERTQEEILDDQDCSEMED